MRWPVVRVLIQARPSQVENDPKSDLLQCWLAWYDPRQVAGLLPPWERIPADRYTEVTQMAGISPIGTANSAAVQSLFQARATLPALLRAQDQFRAASFDLARPTIDIAANRQLRALRGQLGVFQGELNQTTEMRDRLQTMLTGLNTISSALSDIQDLVDDTNTTPGNAVANQAVIDNLVATVKNTVDSLRLVQANPTFEFQNLDARISDLALFAADGTRIDDNGISIAINVTQDARRAEIFTFLDDYYRTDAQTQIRITGPGGTSALIDLNPSAGQIVDAIRNVDLNNTEAVTFEIWGGDHIGTGVDYSTVRTVNTVAGTAAEIVDALVGINEAFNYGDIVFEIGTETTAPVQFTIDGGTQAVINNAITTFRTTFNTGDRSFDVQNVNAGYSLENFTILSGDQAISNGAVTAVNESYNTGATTFQIQGRLGTRNIATDPGTQAVRNNVLQNVDDFQDRNRGDFTIRISGFDGAANATADIVVSGGTVAETGVVIQALNFNIFGDSTINLQVTDTNGTLDGVTLTLESGNTTVAQAVTNLNNSITAEGFAGRIEAYDAGGGVGFRTFDSGDDVRVRTNGFGDGSFGALIFTARDDTGDAGDSAATIRAAINAVRGTTGVTATGGGTNVNLEATDTGSAADRFGSDTRVGLTVIAGTPFAGTGSAFENEGIVNGTDGDTLADVVTLINNETNLTGVQARLEGGQINLYSTIASGAEDEFGSLTRARLLNIAGGNAAIANLVDDFGSAGTDRDTLRDAINATTATSGILAVDQGAGIQLRAVDLNGDAIFGSDSQIVISGAAGGGSSPAGVVNNQTDTGNDGDTRDDVINTINALRNVTGVIASAGGSADAITLTTSSVGTTLVGQIDDDGLAGTGNIEEITISEVTIPNPLQTSRVNDISGTLNAQGTNSTSRAELIALINGFTAQTRIVASNGTGGLNDGRITLTSNLLGLGANVNIRPTVNPEGTPYVPVLGYNPAADNNEDISFSTADGVRDVSYGRVVGIHGGDAPNAATFTAIRDESLNRINTAANPIGVEAFVNDNSNGPTVNPVAADNAFSLSLRSFLFGGAFQITALTNGGGTTSDADTVLNNPSDIGEHAIATVSVDGSTPQTLDSTNPGDNPATGSGGTFAFGENGVAVNQFSFNVNGVFGQFGVPVDEVFTPATVTAIQDTSLFLPLVDSQSNFLTRFNFNTLNSNFLGDFVLDRTNVGTRGRTDTPPIEIPRGGIKDIDVTGGLAARSVAAPAIIGQAITDVQRDIDTANTLLNNLIEPIRTQTQARIDDSEDRATEIEDFIAARQAVVEVDAQARIDALSPVLAQYASLFPAAILPLLGD